MLPVPEQWARLISLCRVTGVSVLSTLFDVLLGDEGSLTSIVRCNRSVLMFGF